MPLKNRPVALVLTRQNLPTLDRTKYAAASGLARGGYVLAEAEGPSRRSILIGTGSEVSLCVQAYEQLAAEGIQARVVSMPCWELFDEQDEEYRESVLPPAVTARRGGRDRHRAGLGEISRSARTVHRHDRLRRLGPCRGAVQAFWLHRRKRRARQGEGRKCCGRKECNASQAVSCDAQSPRAA